MFLVGGCCSLYHLNGGRSLNVVAMTNYNYDIEKEESTPLQIHLQKMAATMIHEGGHQLNASVIDFCHLLSMRVLHFAARRGRE